MQLRDYQQRTKDNVYRIWQSGKKNALAVLPTGAGKCLGKDTPVMMFDGRLKPVQEVRNGECVMGPDGEPRLVTGVTKGVGELYRVTPVKGDPYVVNDEHILSLKTTTSGEREIVNIPVKEYVTKNKTFKHTHKGWRTSVDFHYDPQTPEVDPYFLGLWLGDGSNRNQGITTPDAEIIEYLYNLADKMNLTVSLIEGKGNCVRVNLVRKKGERSKLMDFLRSNDLLCNKHIPHTYKTAPRSDRLKLLAGLMDSDGHYDGKSYDFITKDERLMDDMLFVARSLGFYGYKKKCRKTCTNTGATEVYYRCNLSGPLAEIPCIVKHKKATHNSRSNRDGLVTGIKVEPIGEGEYFGFELIGNDKLFLLGDFTVTHNTVCFTNIMSEEAGPCVAIAHRQELVSQMSMTLARHGIYHRIMGPLDVIRFCSAQHLRELNQSYVVQDSKVTVAGVNTLVSRKSKLKTWGQSIQLWVQDEAQHLLRDNIWGRANELFPNARGLGVTATPCRADGKGLGRHASGVIDEMTVGPTMRDLITQGFLTEYRVFAPPSDLNLDHVEVGSTGDFKAPQLKKAVKQSHVVGDVVDHYTRLANGKLGVTFATDVDTATEISREYNDAGVPSAVVTAKTPNAQRAELIRRFRDRELMQLVNVDLFGEGFDLPAIEVVSMARPTQSYGLYVQQFGRALRPLDGKSHALIIDHVGNVTRHGLPDAPRNWTLDDRSKRERNSDNGIQCRTCPSCTGVYERVKRVCPYCGHYPEPVERSGPEHVDGDLEELTPDVLAKLRGEVINTETPRQDVVQSYLSTGVPEYIAQINASRFTKTQDAQRELRDAIGWYGAWARFRGEPDNESQRRFFLKYGVDILTAQSLKESDANDLRMRIIGDL